MEVMLILCDWAEQINGKLYMMGAGWSRVLAGTPLLIGVGVLLKVPWNKTNEQHRLQVAIIGADGQAVTQPTPAGDQPVQIEGKFEVGRPPGLTPGTDIDSPLAFKIGPLLLPPGRYVCELQIDGSQEATAPFEVVPMPQLPGGMFQQ